MIDVTMPRESIEYLKVEPTDVSNPAAPVPWAGGFKVCVKPDGARPADWIDAVAVDDGRGILINGPALGEGRFRVWARIEDNPEAPVISCGYVTLT